MRPKLQSSLNVQLSRLTINRLKATSNANF